MDRHQRFVRVSMNVNVANIPATEIIKRVAEFIDGIGWSIDGLEHEVMIDTLSVQEFEKLEGGSNE